MIIISGQTPSHKNSKQIFRSKSGRTILANNDRYLNWRGGAIIEVLNQAKKSYKAAEIEMTFYTKDRRGRDLDNMVASVLDVLVHANVIEDDNCFMVRGIHAYFGGIDRVKPRVEIKICELEINFE